MEILNNIDFDFMIRFLKGIQSLIGNNCEIIVNDFRKGYDHTIVHAINSELSQREIGGKPRGAMIVHHNEDLKNLKDNYIFFYNGKDNKKFKSSTTLITNNDNKVIGSICINIEISKFMDVQNILNEFLQISIDDNSNNINNDDISINNIDDVLEYYFNEVEKIIGKKMILMDKEEKIKSLKFLDDKGVMKISKANITLCEKFGISKFTLYNYLEEARKS